jgi:hypothetical protein
MDTRRRRHPLLRAVVFGVAAVYAFALGIYGAVAIPHRRLLLLDFGPRHRIWLENPNNRIGLRILCLVAGFAVALLLARAANVRRFRRERLGLRAF